MRRRQLVVSYTYRDAEDDKPYPFIRLRGRWLERVGFVIGSSIEVTADDGIVVIVLKTKGEE